MALRLTTTSCSFIHALDHPWLKGELASAAEVARALHERKPGQARNSHLESIMRPASQVFRDVLIAAHHIVSPQGTDGQGDVSRYIPLYQSKPVAFVFHAIFTNIKFSFSPSSPWRLTVPMKIGRLRSCTRATALVSKYPKLNPPHLPLSLRLSGTPGIQVRHGSVFFLL